MIATATWVPERMQAAADAEASAATDLAEWLVQRGTPFREAHAAVGTLVRRSLAGEGALRDLVEADPLLGSEAAALVAPGVSVRRRTTPGGAGPVPVAEQIERLLPRPSDCAAVGEASAVSFFRPGAGSRPDCSTSCSSSVTRPAASSRSRPTPDDPASHTYRGRKRNDVMFGPFPDHLYVLRLRDVPLRHHVTGPVGDGQAVLIRARCAKGVDRQRRTEPASCAVTSIDLSFNGRWRPCSTTV
jgi:hypothetical protein